MSGLPEIGDMDYVVVRGQVYDVVRDHYDSDPCLKKVDEIPTEYWDRWPPGDEE